MPKLLPDSSDPSSAEIQRIQRQCDLARDEHSIDTVDTQDRIECTAWLERVTCSDLAPRFSKIECLGLGAYGLVFATEDRQYPSKLVAVKVLRPSKANQRVPRERFEFEGQVLSSLKHPHVVEHFETGEIDGVVYHVVELADCGSLACVLSEQQMVFSPRQAAWLISKLADALQEAHSIPVLHRDIKPGNILLKACDPRDSEGLGLWPLLTDFGLSKKLDYSTDEPLTNYGEILGTLAYMSPEQVQGKAMRTPSDLFSLGVILHELVYRAHPFDDRGHFQTLTNIVQNPTRKPHRTGLQVPSSLHAIMAKCLQKDSRLRYRSAGDLAEDLRRFLRGELISIATPTPLESLVALASNHPKLSIFLGTLIASLLTFVLVLDREWRLQQNLAQEKGKISELFLQSMLGTNSSLNDSILSGKRVSPSELLENLEQKLPVLEDAHRLAPDDLRLIRHLEVMSHYISLCYYHESTVIAKESKQQKIQKAREFRAKSLEYIELYNSRVAKGQKLEIPLINGLYLMAVLFENDLAAESPGRIWSSKSISAAENYLAEHPDDEFVQDTLLNTKYLHSYFLGSRPEDLDEKHRLYESVCKASDAAYQKFPHRLEFLVLHIRTLSDLGVLLLEMGKEDESNRVFESLDALIADPKISDHEDWRVFDRLIATYPSRFRVLFSCNRYREAIELTRRWEQAILAPQRQTYYDALHEFHSGKDVGLLISRYLRWNALLAVQPGSREESVAMREARAALQPCIENEQFDFERMISEIEAYGLPTEAIQEWSRQQGQ